MNQQEAYMQLREKLDAINGAVGEATKFAREHGLSMGQPKGNPAIWECINPTSGRPDDYHWDDFDEDDYWVGSEVCY